MKSLQEAFQKQLNEAAEKAEKQQATINFLKTEMERKSKMIRDLQNENKSLKNKLLSGSKLCGIHAEESKKIQAQLKELRYGKKDLIFKDFLFEKTTILYILMKAQQLTDLEQKLAIAKEELEKAALDKESQLKALKETVQLCLSSVLHNQPPTTNIIPSRPIERHTSPVANGSKIPFRVTNAKQRAPADKETLQVSSRDEDNNQSTWECNSQDVGKTCLGNQNNSTSSQRKVAETDLQKSHSPPWMKPEIKKSTERKENNPEELAKIKEKTL
ncbi:leucine zipper protein 2 isoform X3 [Rhineura floridana]|nr:leucine zipper protein 2 isoform X3 [Rhineura floridana]XP_061466598.1 leucine zipper protein 2 isoform X3 [Rhineura floridana]